MPGSIKHTRCLALLAFFLSGSLMAQADSRTLGDHPLVDRFPDSELEEIELVEDSSYRLVLGTLQRNREVVVPENSLRLRGDVTKLTYQVSQEFTGEDVYEFFRQQMQDKGYEEMFSCIGRACGSSNYWANDIFRNRILYGPERNQYFVAMRTSDSATSPAHISLYIITRANRRIYAYLEIVEENASSEVVAIASPELLESLNEQGSVVLPGIVFATDTRLSDESNLAPAVELLQSSPELNYYVVAHLGEEGELDDLLARSSRRAETVRQQLIANGVQAERLIARGVGPLAPACEMAECSDRVELVLR